MGSAFIEFDLTVLFVPFISLQTNVIAKSCQHELYYPEPCFSLLYAFNKPLSMYA